MVSQRSPPGFHLKSSFMKMASQSFTEKQNKFKDYVHRHKVDF